MEYVLETHALTKTYKRFTALDGLTMRIPKGAIYGFVGRNGAGKTTLIRLICGLQTPTSGSYSLYGTPYDTAGIARSRVRMGAVVETPSIYLDMTAADNIREQYRVLGVPSDEGIAERTETMRRMTEELLQYSVVTADPTALSLTPVRMNDVLAESLAGFYGALCAKGITPEIRMAEHTVVRLLHAESLRRVFDNILQNAVRYAVRDLCVTLSEEGNVTFANHAPEMSPVQVERLFDRFYTVETARSTTGLGLSIARQLTEKMHGRIDADYENGILTICLRFPQVQDNDPERSTAIKER